MNWQGTETITILRKTAGGVDEYNNTVTTTQEITVTGVFVGWGSTNTAENIDRVTIYNTATFYLPAGTEVLDNDEFRYKGEKWVQEGEAVEWIQPVGFTGNGLPWGKVVNASRAEG